MSPRIAALLVMLGAALVLVTGASAASQPKLNLTSMAAIDDYLRSIGVDPATVVKQAGLLNYAGPNCPGPGWNCTTETKVAQLSLAGGENRTECSGRPEATTTVTQGDQSCLIVQSAPAKGENHARCFEQSDDAAVVQTCTVVQDNAGGGNHAQVKMQNSTSEVSDTTAPVQDAQQSASVTQTNEGGGSNFSDIQESVKQSLSDGTTQTQDAYQTAFVDQTTGGSGNFSHVHQTQDQDETGPATTQNQNTDAQPACVTKNANQCALVSQTNGGGQNDSHVHQAIGERQTTGAATATQTQGTPANGNEGDVHQSNPDGVGHNGDIAHQTVAQRQTSPAGVTTHHQHTDPSCCGASQVGGDTNREFIEQSTTQGADDPMPDQTTTLFGQVHEVSDPSNSCGIVQHARTNDDSEHASVSENGAMCAALFLTTTCVEGACTSTTAPPSPCPEPPCLESTLTILPSTPTYGTDVAMPDYAEPGDYTDPGGWW